MRLRKTWSHQPDRKLAIIRTATTCASDPRNGSGKMKVRNAPRPITLPKVALRDFDAEDAKR